MTYGDRLREWREARGYTLTEVADLTGLTGGYLGRVERGERQLSVDARVRIARRLGVPLRDLFPVEPLPVSA